MLHASLPKADEKASEKRPSEDPNKMKVQHYDRTTKLHSRHGNCLRCSPSSHKVRLCLNVRFTGRYGNRILEARK